MSWREQADAASERYRDGESRLGDATDEDPRQRQLTRLGNTAWAAGLSLLMAGDRAGADEWLRRAAERYRESWQDAPPDAWGRPIAAMKALLLAGADASEAAHWALDAGAAEAVDPNVKAAIHALEQALGTKVTIQENAGKGKIELHFFSAEEMHRLYDGLIRVRF